MGRVIFKDILDAFGDCPHAMKAVNSNIRRLNKVVKVADRLKFEYKYAPYDQFTRIFLGQVIDYLCPGGLYSEEVAQIEKLRRFKNCVLARKKGDSVGLDIEKARSVSILDLYDFGKVKRSGRRIWTLCPFHNDSRPSMLINENNTFKCFSCGVGGDSINFIRQLHGVGFVEAVRMING